MFNGEEKKLQKWKSEIEKVETPESRLEQAIKNGFNRAKKVRSVKKRTRYKRSIWSAVVAALLLIALVTSIRVSPAFASSISSIPGMEKIVELIRYDKGIVSAIENDYFQALGISSEKDGVTLTLEGVIADERELVLFYTIKGVKWDSYFSLEDLDVYYRNSKESVGDNVGGSSYEDKRKSNELAISTNIHFDEESDETEFVFKTTVETENKAVDFEIPFTLEKVKQPTQVFNVNETVEIEGQELTIHKVEISPLRTGVHFQMNPANTKEVFSFEDLRLVDEKGETWTSFRNGLTMEGRQDEERIVYLQSNYFEQPGQLFLEFNQLQALDKDETNVLVDIDKEIILEQPPDGRFKEVKVEEEWITFEFDSGSVIHMFPFESEVEMVESMEIVHAKSVGLGELDNGNVKLIVDVAPEYRKGLMKLPIAAFPQWIEGDVKLRIK